jgi:S-adenosylmethionine synthetase
LSYAIGIDKPLAIYINTDKGILQPRESLYEECTPNNIMKEFDLRNFDYTKTAQFGHFGFDFPWERV